MTWFCSRAPAATIPSTIPIVMMGMITRLVKITAAYSFGLVVGVKKKNR